MDCNHLRRYGALLLIVATNHFASATLSFALPALNAAAVSSPAYYIREGGSSFTCTDWANACAALPQTLQRGATYYIADGSYSNYTFDDAVVGTELITIRKATANDHGSDIGWHSSYGDGTAQWASVEFLTSYWVFDGVTGGGPGAWTSGFGFTFSTPAGTAIEYVDLPTNVSHITVRHCSFIQIGNTEQFVTGADAIYSPTSGGLSDSLIEYNYFDNLGGLPFFLRRGSHNVIQYNYSGNICGISVKDPDQHCEALVLHDMDDVHFRWNYISESPSSGGFVKNNTQTSDAVRIYGNVFRNGFPIQCNTGACTNWRIFNNTFVGVSGPVGGDGARSRFLIYNNITYDGEVTPYPEAHNYNWYSTIRSNSCSMSPNANENVNKEYPSDCDTITETYTPFVNVNGTDPESLRLSAPMQGFVGTDVCVLDACDSEKRYNVDLFGLTRGSGGRWDVGAYQYTIGPTTNSSPSAPKNLRVSDTP